MLGASKCLVSLLESRSELSDVWIEVFCKCEPWCDVSPAQFVQNWAFEKTVALFRGLLDLNQKVSILLNGAAKLIQSLPNADRTSQHGIVIVLNTNKHSAPMTANSSPAEVAHLQGDSRGRQISAAQVRMLYGNVNVGVVVTLVAATILGRLQWGVISHRIILGWCLFTFLIAAARFTLGRHYRRAAPSSLKTRNWATAFTIGAGLAGAGWGAAGILLYPDDHLENQVFLAFILD